MKTKNLQKLCYMAIALVMVACTSEKVDGSDASDTSNSDQIGFSSYATIAKGEPIEGNTDFIDGDHDFGVAAYISTTSTSPYMGSTTEGAQIVYDTDWDYNDNSDSRYWPTNGETLDFYAYSPFDDTNRGGELTITSGDLTIEGYTVPSDITAQEDFMYASALDITSSSTDVNDGALTLLFKHGLTQINFEVSTAQSNLYAEIESIILGNVYSSGDFSLGSGWSSQSELLEYTAKISSGDVIGNTVVDLTSDQDDILMLLPQTFTAWNGTDDITDDTTTGEGAYIKVSCKLYNVTDNIKTYIIGSDDEDGFVTTAMPLSSIKDDAYEWTAGKSLTFSIIFAAEGSSSGGGGYSPEGDDDSDGELDAVPTIYPISFTTDVDLWAITSGSIVM